MNLEDKLSEALDVLENKVRITESRLQARIDAGHYGGSQFTVDDLEDANGRPVLLDARIALVNGLAALLRIA